MYMYTHLVIGNKIKNNGNNSEPFLGLERLELFLVVYLWYKEEARVSWRGFDV